MYDPFELNSEHGTYTLSSAVTSTQIINMALKLARHQQPPASISSTQQTIQFFEDRLSLLEHEVFGVLLLTNKHKCIEFVELFRGTIDGAAVYPREVVKLVLEHNAAAVIFAHNHPSGSSTPSAADKAITRRLTDALRLIDVRVLDHIVVGHPYSTSFAETGLL